MKKIHSKARILCINPILQAMGVTIFYKGKLDQPELINDFIDEMEDIAKSMEWDFKTIKESNDPQETSLNGIFILPHKDSEPLSLVFDQEGCLRNIIMLKYGGEKPEFTYINFIKTQFAPAEIHVAAIKLLRYIQKKYIANLNVNDEGGYWETGNASLLKERINFLNSKIDELKKDLRSITIKEDDSPESIADKIENLLSDKLLKGHLPKQK